MHKRLCGACHRSIRSESAMPQEPISYPMALLSAESEPWCNKNMLYDREGEEFALYEPNKAANVGIMARLINFSGKKT